MDISVEVATQTTGSPHKLWAEFDVDRTTVSIPGQSEALLLGHQNIVGDLLQLQVMDVVRQFNTGYKQTDDEKTYIKSYPLTYNIVLAVYSAQREKAYWLGLSVLCIPVVYRWPLKVTFVLCSLTSPSQGRKSLMERVQLYVEAWQPGSLWTCRGK